jgi:hypothetical protein
MLLQFIYRFLSSNLSQQSWCRLAILSVAIGCQQAILLPARSQESVMTKAAPTTPAAPAALTTILTSIDIAASQRQLPELSRYYSADFSTSDGLNKATWQQSLNKFWQSYNNIKYTTTLESWKSQENGYTAKTTTRITGIQNLNGRTQNLQATIQSRQKIVGGQIVQQQILQERTQISSGIKPPTIEINLPERLQTNAEYSLDAIVTEPLGEDVLMGTTVEQPVSAQGYDLQSKYKLELLTAGGLFKIARAPGKSGDYWVSTMFIRPTGMTTITQRIHVVRGK